MAASDEATPTSGNSKRASNSLKHMGGGGGGADDSNSKESQSIVANEEQQATNGHVQQTATQTTTSTTTTQYDVEHLATFSTTSSHETSTLGGTNDHDHDDEATKATIARDESTTTTTTPPTSSTSVATREPRVALQRLFELEKLSGIWTQRMQIELRPQVMLILDCETNSIVERFSRQRITKPESFSQYNDIYNNIIVFLIEPERQVDGIKESSSSSSTLAAQQKKQRFKKGNQEDCASTSSSNSSAAGGELHIFQCVSHQAQQLVDDIIAWKSSGGTECTLSQEETTTQVNSQESSLQKVEKLKDNHSTPATATAADMNKSALSQAESSNSVSMASKALVAVASAQQAGDNVPIVNVNVKETVQVFNQIAALREKGASNQAAARPLSTSTEVTTSSSSSAASDNSTRAAAAVEPVAFYKQRSIRAILAPKLESSAAAAADQSKGEASSASMAGETSHESNGKPATTTTSTSSTVSSSASSAADGNNQQSKRVASSNKLPPPPPPSSNHKNSNGIKTPLSSSGGAGNQQAASKLHNKEGNNNNKTAKQSTSASSSSTCSSGAAARAHNNNNSQQQQHSSQQSDSSRGSHASPSSQLEQVTTNESYVSVLNHCFDDIEKFIIRLQQAYTAVRELQAKRRQSKRSNHQLALAAAAAAAAAATAAKTTSPQQQNGNKSQPPVPLTASELALLSARARGPTADDFFEILSKFKLAFNLLAKLKGCIHEPNAPELVHFLFTPLAIIIESARNVSPPVDPTVVGIPYLNKEALDLLSNCCTSKESDLWLSLGPNWTQTIDIQVLKASRLPSSFQPIFSDGWAPVIAELELIGLVPPPPPPSVHELDQHYRSSRAICAAPPGAVVELADSSEPSLIASGRHNASRGAYKNGTSDHQHTNNNNTKHKRSSPPTGNGVARHQQQHYLEASKTQAISPTPYGYQQQREPYIPADLNGDEQTLMLDHHHQYGGRATRLPPNNHHHPHHRSTRHSLPHNEQHLIVSKTKSSNNSRRNSDYPGGYAAGQHFTQPPASYGGFDDPGYPVTDGYAELEEDYRHQHQLAVAAGRRARDLNGRSAVDYLPPMYDNNAPLPPPHSTSSSNRLTSSYDDHSAYLPQSLPPPPLPQPPGAPASFYIDEAEREAMLLDLGPIQTEWFYELTARNALIVRVLFSREANNDKELTVKRGEVLEILDDSRKWWKARNIELQVAYVPHTIVAVMEHYQTLDELLTNSPCDMMMMTTVGGDNPAMAAVNSQRFSRRQLQANNNDSNFNHQNGNHGFKETRRNAKTAGGAFRYF